MNPGIIYYISLSQLAEGFAKITWLLPLNQTTALLRDRGRDRGPVTHLQGVVGYHDLGSSLDHLVSLLDRLGPSWRNLGGSMQNLGSHGEILEGLGPLLGSSLEGHRMLFGHSWAFLGDLGQLFGRSCGALGPFWVGL